MHVSLMGAGVWPYAWHCHLIAVLELEKRHMMEQDITGMSDTSQPPDHLPDDIEEPGSAELAAELVREQVSGPVPLGPAIPGQGEDAVLLVETVTTPDQLEALSPEDTILGRIDLEEGAPWYRSRWFYLGAGLVGGTALATGAVLLIRNRRARRRTAFWRAQNALSQWSNQLGGQTDRLTSQVRRLTRQKRKPTSQLGKLSGQGQQQLSRLASSAQEATLSHMPFQRQSSASKWLKQSRRQLTNLSQQAGGQLSSIGAATRATTAQAIGKTQAGLVQVRQGVASGAARTGEGIKSGWKFSRNFTLGMTAGAMWAALFTPQSGETTRRRFAAILPARRPRKP